MKASEAVKLSNQGREDLINRYREDNKEILSYIYAEIVNKCNDGHRRLSVVYFHSGDRIPCPQKGQGLILLHARKNDIDHIIEVLIHDGYRSRNEALDRIIKIEW